MRRMLMMPVLLLMIVAGCDAIEDATSEDVVKTFSQEVTIVTSGAETGETEVSFNVCAMTDLCDQWDYVESIEVTALAYELTYFESTNGTQPVSIDGAMYYMMDNAWVHLTDVVMSDLSANVGNRIDIPVSPAVGSDLGSMLMTDQSFSAKISGETSDAILASIEIFVTVKATIAL